MPTRFKFRHVNEFVGLFVMGVIALVVLGVVFSSHSQRWFARKFSFDVLLPQAGALGLRRGDEVFILGVSAGLVDDVIVQDDGRVKAHVRMRRDFERFVRADSTASIKKAFAVAGDSYMEISAGTGAPLQGSNATIVCVPSEDSLGRIEKIVNDLQAELIPVVKQAGLGLQQWTRLGADLEKDSEQLRQFIGRLDQLATRVEKGEGTAGKLLTETTLMDEAEKLLIGANQTLGELRGAVTNLNGAIANVQKGTARLPEVSDALANEAKDLPGLVAQTQTSMRELERLIEGMQRHWLVRKYMSKTNSTTTRSQPQEAGRRTLKAVSAHKGSK